MLGFLILSLSLFSVALHLPLFIFVLLLLLLSSNLRSTTSPQPAATKPSQDRGIHTEEPAMITIVISTEDAKLRSLQHITFSSS